MKIAVLMKLVLQEFAQENEKVSRDLGSGFIGLQYSNFCDSLTEGQNEK